MSNNLTSKKVVLFGPGKMGVEYTKVLQHLGVNLSCVVGLTADDVERFRSQTALTAIAGGFSTWKQECNTDVGYAIVAVSVNQLSRTAIDLMNFGIRKILLEKPGGLNIQEIKLVRDTAKDTGSEILVGYNRRFYASVLKAQKIIKEDGGVKSFNFEFTEWPEMVNKAIKNKTVKRNWFLANSTHVIDLAFFLGGKPNQLESFIAGGCHWHPAATIFSGAGTTKNNALFSYQANWLGPGRWSVELVTDHHRLIFRPLEKLQIQLNGSVKIEFVEIDDRLDTDFKPGLFKQTQFFLEDANHSNFVNIHEHYENVVNYFQKIIEPPQSKVSCKKQLLQLSPKRGESEMVESSQYY